jgi:lipopolysaccharide exporter
MSSARDVWRSTALTAVGSQATGLMSFASSIVIARAMAPAEVGRYALVAAIVAIATGAGSMQMNGYCVVVDRLTPRVLRSALALELSAGIATFGLLAAGAVAYVAATHDLAFAGLLLLGGLVLLTNPFGCLASSFNRRLSYGPSTQAQVVTQALGATIKAGLAVAGLGAWGLLIGDVTISAAYAIWMLRLVPEGRAVAFDRANLRAQLQFGVPSMLTGLLSTGAQRGQDIVVAATLGTRQLGFFYLASRICGQVYQLGRSLTVPLLPAFSRVRDAQLERRFTKVTRLSAFFVAAPLAVLIAEGRDLVTAVFGERWQPAAVPLTLLFAAVGLRFVFWHVGNLLKSQARVREMTVLTAAQLVLLLAGSYLGARLHGLIGLAVASVVVEALLTLPRLRLIRSVVRFSNRSTFWAPVGTLLVAAAVARSVAAWTGGVGGLIVTGAAVAAVFAAALWLTEHATILTASAAFRRETEHVQPQS